MAVAAGAGLSAWGRTSQDDPMAALLKGLAAVPRAQSFQPPSGWGSGAGGGTGGGTGSGGSAVKGGQGVGAARAEPAVQGKLVAARPRPAQAQAQEQDQQSSGSESEWEGSWEVQLAPNAAHVTVATALPHSHARHGTVTRLLNPLDNPSESQGGAVRGGAEADLVATQAAATVPPVAVPPAFNPSPQPYTLAAATPSGQGGGLSRRQLACSDCILWNSLVSHL